MFLDVRPASYPVALITSHELAEQITKTTKQQPYSTTKTPQMKEGLRRIIGNFSLITLEGESWKALRKQFNPGFAPQHLLSLLPFVVGHTYTFMERLDAIASSGAVVEMERLAVDVSFDIIGQVVTNIDCRAQDETIQGNDIVKNFSSLMTTYESKHDFMIQFLDIRRHIKRYICSRRLDAAIKRCVKDKFDAIQAGESDKKDRSVLALALKDTEQLTPIIWQSITDQVKSFLFAGHDTTSILLERAIYALSIHPECLRKIRAEHESIFGDSDPKEVFLARPDETIKALVYTSACIKEALRLWPPAATARMSHNGLKIQTSEGEEVCLDGCMLYLVHYIIQRDPKVYGDRAEDFVPERWVGDIDTSSATVDQDGSATGASKIPISAWRPFERGPRNCIGQELANLEARVILACVMRRYDFVKVGEGEVETDEKGLPIVDERGKYRTKSELLNTQSITSKPIDKMRMKIKFHGAAARV
jgi:cytochrome P450